MLRVRRGIYRLVHFPAGEHEELVMVWLWSKQAHTTKDIDLRFMGSPEHVLERLQQAARLDLGDWFTFEVGPDSDHPEIHNAGMQHDGMRLVAECRLAGRIYGQRFGVDIAFGDPILGEPEAVTASDVLGFVGVAPSRPTLPWGVLSIDNGGRSAAQHPDARAWSRTLVRSDTGG